MVTCDILGGGVAVFRNVIDVSTSREFTTSVEQNNKPPYTPEVDGVGFDFRPNGNVETPSRFFVNPAHPSCTMWDSVLYKCLVSYCRTFRDAMRTVQWTFAGHLLSYKNKQHIGWHSDNVIPKYPKQLFGVAPSENQFSVYLTLSTLLYLNDDYHGGEIQFKHPSMSYKPEAGSVIFYPSSFMGAHQVLPITSGQRLAYVKFYGHGWPSSHSTHALHWLPSLGDDICEL